MIKKAAILGASSGIGREIAGVLASKGYDLLLFARNKRDLDAIVQDLNIRYQNNNYSSSLNVTNLNERKKIINIISKNGPVNNIYITIGQVNKLDNGIQHTKEIHDLILINFSAIVMLISDLIRVLNHDITFAIITSIAVARPRMNNVVYSASKMALDFYCRALQHRYANKLYKKKGRTLKIQIFRLGYVDTAMSFGKQLLLPVCSPKKAAKKITSNGRIFNRIIYLPGYWRFIVLLIRLIPWFVYKRISF